MAAEARLAAWCALSDLFLDTELGDADIADIARRLQATGLQVAEIERIYEDEVAPVCWRNLEAVPGGVWTRFDPGWLERAIEAHLAAPPALHGWPWVARWRMQRWTSRSRPDWQRVRGQLAVPDPGATPAPP